MPPEVWQFVLTSGLIIGSMLGGYIARRRFKLDEAVARKLMWLVVVCGYSSVGLLSTWQTRLVAGDIWLPVLAMIFITGITFIGLGLGRLLTKDPAERGLFAIAVGLGNAGFTMGGFLCYVMFGNEGLGRASIYCLPWNLLLAGLMYPIARHYSDASHRKVPMGALVLRSLFDVRAMGLYAVIAGLILNALTGAKAPAFLAETPVKDVIMFATAVCAFFSVGLRLRFERMKAVWKLVLGLAGVRFILAPAIGLLLVQATVWIGYPIGELSRKVFLVESCIPTAITMVAIANLFDLRPREASALFVTNTLLYLVTCLPLVVWLLG